MKVKHVINDLGPKTLVQIYTPSNTGHIDRCFVEAYTVEVLIGVQGIDVLGKYLDRDIDHVEYGHYYNVTDDMVASCDIYLKAEQTANEEEHAEKIEQILASINENLERIATSLEKMEPTVYKLPKYDLPFHLPEVEETLEESNDTEYDTEYKGGTV